MLQPDEKNRPSPAGSRGAPSPVEVQRAISRGHKVLLRTQRKDGSWDAQGRVGPWTTAQAVVVLCHLGRMSPEDKKEAARWLRGQQRKDGGFVVHPFARDGDLGTTAATWAALSLADPAGSEDAISRARDFVARHGGDAGLLSALEEGDLSVVYFALAGLIDPKSIPCPSALSLSPLFLPPVVKLLATRFNFGVFHMAFELEVVLRRMRGDWGADGKHRGVLGTLTCLRLQQLLRPFQNPDGSFNDSVVLTVMALAALSAAGLTNDDPMLSRALQWFEAQAVRDADGLRYDGFGTEVWSTSFDLRALLGSGAAPSAPPLTQALQWLARAQLTTPMPRVDHRQRGPLTGGWAFQRSNPSMPDCDDTAVALSALGMALKVRGEGALEATVRPGLQASADKGRSWLLGMQNPDGGWSAFVWGLPGKRPGPTLQTPPRVKLQDPLAMFGLALHPPASLGDPSTEDITSRVLHGLGQLGGTVGTPSIARAVEFLRVQQCDFGGWWGRWVVNYLSCTAFVLRGLKAVGADLEVEWVRKAVRWMASRQNPDGGFGEGPASYRDETQAGVGPSMPPLTGLVLQGLLDAGGADPAVLDRAAAYLVREQHGDGSWPNGLYLHTNVPPNTFYLYPEAAKFYPTEALGLYQSVRQANHGDFPVPRWSNAFMDAARKVMDPPADDVVRGIYEAGQADAVNQLLRNLWASDEPIPKELPPAALAYFHDTEALPSWTDPAQIALAQQLFTRAGWQVTMALFCSSLPQAYCAAKGAHVLAQTGAMQKRTSQRIYETAQFLFDVLDDGGLAPSGRGVRSIQKVRLLHGAVRHFILHAKTPWPVEREGMPINQEDLAGTLMTFGRVTLDGLVKLDVKVSAAEGEAWMHLWRVVGHLLGLREDMLPRDAADAETLMDAIRDRQWRASPDGKSLTQALVEMMQSHMGAPELQGMPVTLIRTLAGDHCADMLGLPAGDWTRAITRGVELVDRLGLTTRPDPLSTLWAYATHQFMEQLVEWERQGKQARFRLPNSIKDTVDPRF